MRSPAAPIRSALPVMFALVTALPGVGVAGEDQPIDFARDVAPILESHCLSCHTTENRKGGVALSTGEDLIGLEYVLVGDPDASDLIALVTPEAEGGRPRMPLKGDPLSAEQVDTLRRWIASGADWPEGLTLSAGETEIWWSLRPLTEASPPEPGGILDAWKSNPIDRFVFEKMAGAGLSPSPPADCRTLIRRASFDLVGLPPTPEEVDAFVDDDRPDAYEHLIDRLLASPHYGERWGRHWLDVVRFGESNGFERNVLINNAWPFRDAMIRAFNEDRPFDRLVLEHLAGDVIGAGDPAVEVGTAFLVCGPYDDVGNLDPVQAAQIRANTVDDMVRATGEAFLGLTVGCARCHDHKFDPILQRDYYALADALSGVHHDSRVVATGEQRRQDAERRAPLIADRDRLNAEIASLREAIRSRAEADAAGIEAEWTRPSVDRTGTEESFDPIEARFVRLVVEGLDTDPDRSAGARLEEFQVWTPGDAPRNVALASNGGSAEGPSRVAEDFADAYSADLTIDGRFGSRWISGGDRLTITLARPETIARVWFSSDRSGAAGDLGEATFVGEYRIEASTDGESWVVVASSHDRRPANEAHRQRRLFDREASPEDLARLDRLRDELDQVNASLAAIPPLPEWWVGSFREPEGPSRVFLGGDPQRPGDPVTTSSLSALGHLDSAFSLPADTPEAGRRLALARWIVAEDNPLTPRVLANRLWLGHFGAGIVATPSDFGAMGGEPSHPELLDWLAGQVRRNGWRLKPMHRLIMTSQAYRQSSAFRAEAASVDGDSRLLWRFPPRRLSGEEVRDAILSIAGALDPEMGGPGFRLYRYLEDNVATYVPLDAPGPETYRRAVYHQNARAMRVDLLTDFDCPDPAAAAPRRSSTTTPLQALTLLNHEFTLDMARALASRLSRDSGDDPEAQVRLAFELAFARGPDDAERAAAVALIDRHGLDAFCRAILNANELISLD
ncbi:DUF1553 domain-containing protein [Tautonia plasticadhaerens]|uniref:F5/8 type C domain protein n=1 Tax=Tautonia plasticadhaerens TaxID=2527974 RepID=A0A518HAJ8_9BACT|nr:DUF1553 domain-containing protein [Tautonia plasticadhaerens]QDV37871.1 F5/8 type C domain protein [Tautonia plasticadhaerens]